MTIVPSTEASRGQVHLFPVARLGSAAAFHAYSRPARTFTGDFYFTSRADDQLWLAVGDVAGKGLPAAIFMAMIQEEIEQRLGSCALTKCDPASTMERLHAFLRPLLPRNRFATMAVASLRDDGTLVIANGGHCPPLLRRRDGSVEAIGSTGPVVGMLPSPRWSSRTLQMVPGDILFLYSDGLLEAKGKDGEEFGRERIEKVLAPFRGDPEGLVTAMREAVECHAGTPDDDLTLVAIRM